MLLFFGFFFLNYCYVTQEGTENTSVWNQILS